MDKVEKNAIIFLSIITILAIIFCIYLDYGDSDHVYTNYVVTDKTVKNEKDNSKYLIYTKDTEGNVTVFSIEDRFWCGRFNSSDDYARIEIGKTYNFTTVGIRSYFWSSYPDIIELEEVK